jgi:hypothetical protein
VGLRVCPTREGALEVTTAPGVATIGFTPSAPGWLLLTIDAADVATSLDDAVVKARAQLVAQVAAARGNVGVAALVDAAAAFRTVNLEPIGAC